MSCLFALFCSGLLAQTTHLVSGNVYNDINGGTTIDNSAIPFSLPKESLVVVLIETTGNTVAYTDLVEPDGSFSFPAVENDEYYLMLITPNASTLEGDPAPPAILETGWTHTGELVPPAVVPDDTPNGRTEPFTVSDDITGILYGIQERPFADNKMNTAFDNTEVSPLALSVDAGSAFTQNGIDPDLLTGSDNSGGTIEDYTINVLPKFGTLYLEDVPVTLLSQVESLTPAEFNTLEYLPDPSLALKQEMDFFTYFVTDNVGSKSNNATYAIPFQLIDSDGDEVADRGDLDDDNDGITDVAECDLNDLTTLLGAYQGGAFTYLKPSDFGFDENDPEQRVGLLLTQDVSSVFSKPPGSIMVTISNANTHPTADVFYVNDSTGASQWTISGTLGAYTIIDQGLQYFSYDTRTITLLNGTPQRFIAPQENDPLPANWSAGSDGFNWWVTNDNPLADPVSEEVLTIGLTNPEPKYFQVASTANNRDEWATYFIGLLPECDYDDDGIPNRTDLDSDNDGCLDALEGESAFTYDDIDDRGGTVWTGDGSTAENQNLCNGPECVDEDGIPDPVSSGGGQAPDETYNEEVMSQVCIDALPVTLAEFTAHRSEERVMLNWTTVNETNNSGFEIEHSTDGRTWKNIGFVKHQGENGNSNIGIRYHFADQNPMAGQNYYRLKQVDFDRSFEYSIIRSVWMNGEGLVKIYPNPASNRLVIEGLERGELVKVFDGLGRNIYSEKADNTTIQSPVDNLSEGIYTVQIIHKNGKRTVHKFVKTK